MSGTISKFLAVLESSKFLGIPCLSEKFALSSRKNGSVLLKLYINIVLFEIVFSGKKPVVSASIRDFCSYGKYELKNKSIINIIS